MLTRIFLIVAIVASLAVAGLNFTKIKETITTLRSDLASEKGQKEEAQGQLATTRKDLEKTTKERDEAKGEIASANEERDKAVAETENQTKRANKLTEDLTKTRQDLGDSQAELAQWSALGLKPEQLKGLQSDLRQTQANNAQLSDANSKYAMQVKRLSNELDKFMGGDERKVILPADLQGRVLVADPKWEFVVLNVGQNQGVLEDGVLLVNRNGKLVAKVKVRSVQADRCIANVMPNWKLGEVMEGDLVIP